jgi:hypothetical protein
MSCEGMITELDGTVQVHPQVTFGALPDDVLLEIFDFYLAFMSLESDLFESFPEDAWHTLVHVCARWRSIVFASPHRLQLQLLCTNKTPVQKALNIWPELPIVISGRLGTSKRQDAHNIIAALRQYNRVCEIYMNDIPNSLLTRIGAMEMSNPFSALTSLQLSSMEINAPALSAMTSLQLGSTQRNVFALPDSFLGGSAPRLRTLSLEGVPFPALPNLLLSTHDLVELRLWDIHLSGHISPDAMVSGLSALTRLEKLDLEFRFPRSRTDRDDRLVPRLTPVVLPALTELYFKGDSEYLEDIVGQIDTPLLTEFNIAFFNQLIFDTPSLRDFISRTETFKAPHQAEVAFREGEVKVGLYLRDGHVFRHSLSLTISCRPSDWQLSSVTQLCDSALSSSLALERLELYVKPNWKDDVEDAEWLELLHSFTSAKDLLLHDESIQYVAPALEQLAGGRVTEALPTLQNIFLQGPRPPNPVKKAIGKFVVARQLSGCPVAVHHGDWQSPTWQQMHWDIGD